MEDARAALGDDAGDIAALAKLAEKELRPTRGGDLWFRRERRAPFDIEQCHELIASPDVHVVVGTIHDVIVGFGVVEVEELADGTTLGVIAELYVDPGARAVGVGETMMGSLLTYCVDRNCFGVDARVLPGHREAKNFFETSGFTARSITMHHALDR